MLAGLPGGEPAGREGPKQDLFNALCTYYCVNYSRERGQALGAALHHVIRFSHLPSSTSPPPSASPASPAAPRASNALGLVFGSLVVSPV